jgi:N-acetylglutamate synthase-like GNAT family acetyltransferase
MNIDIEIIKANKSHYKEIAELHIASITEGFLSTFGVFFLFRLYEGISNAPNSGICIAFDKANNKVLGFVAYTRDTKTCYKHVLVKKNISLILALIPFLFRLSIYKRIFETLAYPKQEKAIAKCKMEAVHPELLSIAVDEGCRGEGIGELLVKKLDDIFLLMGVKKYYVVTHAIAKHSNAFYKSCGFTLNNEFTNHDKPMNEYTKILKKWKIHKN